MNEHGNRNKHFKGQLDSEIIECFYRKHWIVLAKITIEFILFIAVLIFTGIHFDGLYSFFSKNSFFVAFLALSIVSLFTIFIHKFFLRLVRYYLDITVFTNYRIVDVDKSLYLRNSKNAIDLSKIQDIQKSQYGIVKKLLNFGELIITLSSVSTTKVLTFVPNPDYHFRKINRLKRKIEARKENTSRRINRENPIRNDIKTKNIINQINPVTESSNSGLS
ncbi:hypothetical protein J7J83_03425 [bacterium]|nr:hypothetical protein [bacterium]